MIESRFIEKLLNGREVEWKPLGNILTRTKGTKITAGQMKALHKENAPIKIFAGGKTFALVNFGDIPEKDINKNPSIIVKSRGIIEFEYYDKVFSHKNEMWSYYSQNERISTKYIYYFLKQNEAYFQNIGSKMQMPQIAIPDTDKFLVPIPPLDVQQEIVRILDAFTSLTAELTAELTSRQKQYQYFRDKLLNFDDISDRGDETNPITKALWHNKKVVFKTLGEVTTISIGLTYTPAYVEKGIKFISAQNTSKDYLDLSNVKYISEEEFENSTDNAKPQRDDILFTRVGSNIGHPVIVETDEKLCIFVSLGFLRVKDNNFLFNRYLKHWMSTDLFWKQVEKNVHGSAKINLNTGWLKDFKIPIPPFEEQQRIVAILDKFETLTNSIVDGLPKEIELRRKQYEYYREKLLSFPQ
ncbi:restriction endonuclease subunit S [Glaesserella parasuis]|uniref:restriction endonuclease subunit S n=1 Tax=Glaesserella parasuis TaxID=738 RepID=UPI0024374037|nr:restriction endonuclease subunit S [Glaesserella parasuis]MDG6262737.1 restriction endonuclease subunit S [Glaesserella parasuis]MDP0148883.1 restriction endonuclease subunit S [Glaesserella parasuis]